MLDFKEMSVPVAKQFERLSKHKLYEVDVDRNTLWELYLKSFPEGTNPIYKTRTEYDCNCCKNFVRDVGNVVAFIDGELQTIWDVEVDGIFGIVAKAMSEFVKKQKIKDIFIHWQDRAGQDETKQLTDDNRVINWNHFHCSIPKNFVNKARAPELRGEARTITAVFERGLKEITDEAIEIVEDLIDQDSLYKGVEYKNIITEFKKEKRAYDKLDETGKTIFLWANSHHFFAGIKNNVIGTLLMDLSEGRDVDSSVASFESKVAPSNYKRNKAPITKAMIDSALKVIRDLGYEESLQRRFARVEDVSVNNVVFVDSKVRGAMKGGLEDLLMSQAKTTKKDFSKLEEIEIEDFITNVVPKISEMELMFETKHKGNLMSIIAPEYPQSKNLLKWNNNFSWSYNGEVTDSVKERVKQAGGNVNGVLRVSLSWFNFDDLDIHIIEPNGNKIYHGEKRNPQTSGHLDVDMNISPESREAVENVVWTDANKMGKGTYQVLVNNYNHRESIDIGCAIQIEFNGEIHDYSFPKILGKNTPILQFEWDGKTVTDIKLRTGVEGGGRDQEIWGIKSGILHKVKLMTLSPNFWDDQTIGNKHYFFILENCLNPDDARGLYNEFLNKDFDKLGKVLEVLGGKLKCRHQDNQLSGLGFSVTKRDSITCKVSGNFNRMLKIKF